MLPNLRLPCPVCSMEGERIPLIVHMKEAHKLAVPRLPDLLDPRPYLLLLRARISEQGLEAFASSRCFIRRSDAMVCIDRSLQADKDDRAAGHVCVLRHALRRAQLERTQACYVRGCLVCRDIFRGVRVRDYLKHLEQTHRMYLGNPDNLVYTDLFIECLADRLGRGQCLSCDKVFPTQGLLRQHMKKKRHLRVDGKDHSLDCFYLVNYRDMLDGPEAQRESAWGKGSESEDCPDMDALDTPWDAQAEVEGEGEYAGLDLPDGVAEAWEGLTVPGSQYQTAEAADTGPSVKCLLCESGCVSGQAVLDHMIHAHGADVKAYVDSVSLDTYGCIRLVNYLRAAYDTGALSTVEGGGGASFPPHPVCLSSDPHPLHPWAPRVLAGGEEEREDCYTVQGLSVRFRGDDPLLRPYQDDDEMLCVVPGLAYMEEDE
ncbi:hypothetical protein KIPB_001079 [Kipferlia bialata]|uniref:C2H2-type domain-containing protein n=1 Tax=Kipferlia bialata TaxID=797122 RepID=A0A9K3CQ72_9EUKA|nr:hypothetical protein KIPB_001079 [Kipferlia bialata]|eukprot:g1079.t1